MRSAARRETARAAPTTGYIPAGNHVPIATRNALRRWQTDQCARFDQIEETRRHQRSGATYSRSISPLRNARSVAAASAPVASNSGTRHARRLRSTPRPDPASTRSAATPRSRRRTRLHAVTKRESDNTATCRRPSASARASPRRRPHDRRFRPAAPEKRGSQILP